MNGALIGSMAVLVIIGAANGVIGGLIGICGIAGFLLPMLYTGALGYSVDQALAYSFLAFLVSGCIGAWQYRREGNLDIPLSVKLGAGSAIGAVAGVALQSMIEKETAKAILYVVVLFSGISILFRMWKEKKVQDKKRKSPKKSYRKHRIPFAAWYDDRSSLRFVRSRRSGAGNAAFSGMRCLCKNSGWCCII